MGSYMPLARFTDSKNHHIQAEEQQNSPAFFIPKFGNSPAKSAGKSKNSPVRRGGKFTRAAKIHPLRPSLYARACVACVACARRAWVGMRAIL